MRGLPLKYDSAQAAVECAFLIPVVLLLLLFLIQPGIILYNHTVMKAAASEGCRLLSTKTDASADQSSYEDSIRRHLGSIPQQENFHVHQSGCSWSITLEGNEESDSVKVSIENQLELLPFFDFAAQAMGLTNASGFFVQRVEVQRETYGSWIRESEDGISPNGWVHRDDGLLEGVS